jgi:hypothetical protein
MSAPYKREIRRFIDHFRDEVAAIGNIASPLHRGILLAIALDPLARAAYGPGLNRDRFTRLIRELSGWSECERISLPQLQQRLRAARRSRNRLYRDASKRLNDWGGSLRIDLLRSPVAAELLPLAQANEAKLIAECRYSELFYIYRNNLVHEFREPGYGWDVSGMSVRPFYMSYLGREEQWELTFPIGFLQRLLETTIEGVQTHLLSGKIDPYSQFQFGSTWKGSDRSRG